MQQVPTEPPERTIGQRMEALKRANAIRSARKQLKRDLKSGSISPEAAILMPTAEIENMKVRDLMLAVPTFGPVKVDRALKKSQISPSKTIGGLSPRQRAVLVER